MKRLALLWMFFGSVAFAKVSVKKVPFPKHPLLDPIAIMANYKDAYEVSFVLSDRVGVEEFGLTMQEVSPVLVQVMVRGMLNIWGTGDRWAWLGFEPQLSDLAWDSEGLQVYTILGKGSKSIDPWISFLLKTEKVEAGWNHTLTVTTAVKFKKFRGRAKWYCGGLLGHSFVAPNNIRKLVNYLLNKYPLDG